jgi:hypothetical protein
MYEQLTLPLDFDRIDINTNGKEYNAKLDNISLSPFI